MQQQVQMQQPITLQQVQTTDVRPRHKYKTKLYGLGISEVILGSISVIFGIATVAIATESDFKIYKFWYVYHLLHEFSLPSQGIWCGLFLIATGILGIKAKTNPSVGMYSANMAMSIITANIMVPLMVLSGIAARLASEYIGLYYRNRLAALHSILAIVGFVAAVVCIVHSAYCCAGVCCRRTPHSGPMIYTSHLDGVQQPHQMVRPADGQHMLVTTQSDASQGYTVMPNPMIASQTMY